MKDAVLLMLGAVAGLMAQLIYLSTKSTIAARRALRHERKARHLDSSVKHSRNILEIYRRSGLDGELYATHTFGDQILPILSCPVAGFDRDVLAHDDDLIVAAGLDFKHFPVDDKLIKGKMQRGAKLWDGTAMYLREIDLSPEGRPTLVAGMCNYFGYVSFAQKISVEANKVVGKKPILMGRFSRFSEILSDESGPVTLAGTATCVFESGDGNRVVALQRRSGAVVNATGMLGVAPIFGLECNRIKTAHSKYGIVYYNFLKEFIEEFFGLEPVIRAATTPRADMDWIFALPHASELIAQLEGGFLTLSCTGMGIDLSDGSLTIALLAHFSSPDYLDLLRATATGSWESAEATADRPAIEFFPIDDPSLDAVATIESMDPSSIFSLDLARQRWGLGLREAT